MSEDPMGIQISLPAKPENVAVIRHTLAGLAEEMGMDGPGLADMKTAVTEACMNVVVHAYEGEPGPLSVEAELEAGGFLVVVRDRGDGIRPQADTDSQSLRLGLSLIAALSTSFSISGGHERGTEIRMLMPMRGKDPDAPRRPAGEAVAEGGDATEVVVTRPEVLGPALARLVGALAARRDLSVDRISDALLLTDAIAARAPAVFADGRVRIALQDRESGVELRLGPMKDGKGEQMRSAFGLPEVESSSLESLADELTIQRNGAGDYLVVRFAAPERQGAST